MKVTIEQPVSPSVTIELTGKEAKHLCTILNYSYDSMHRENLSETLRDEIEITSYAIWKELQGAGFLTV